jgi:hypothetical protein
MNANKQTNKERKKERKTKRNPERLVGKGQNKGLELHIV